MRFERRKAWFVPSVVAKALLGQGNQELEVCEMQSRDDSDSGHCHERQQIAIDVLVHGNASDHGHEENDIGGRDAAATWAQTLSTDMGNDAQAQKRDGSTR